MQSCGATKSGIAATFLPLAAVAVAFVALALGAAALFAARASAASPRFEFHTASGFTRPDLAVMNGFGALPLPSAISAMLRPEATDWSASRTLLALPSLAKS